MGENVNKSLNRICFNGKRSSFKVYNNTSETDEASTPVAADSTTEPAAEPTEAVVVDATTKTTTDDDVDGSATADATTEEPTEEEPMSVETDEVVETREKTYEVS